MPSLLALRCSNTPAAAVPCAAAGLVLALAVLLLAAALASQPLPPHGADTRGHASALAAALGCAWLR